MHSKQKRRLDQLLVDRELIETRSKAQARIMAGDVFVKGQRVTKAGTRYDANVDIELRGQSMPYVSRGGLKLEAAIEGFGFMCEDHIVIDVGASTGGFTDCCLQKGARVVYAVDVGYGQLAWSLRSDDRVVVLERENIRTLDQDAIPELCTLAVIDCSFISLEKVLAPTLRFLTADADLLTLIKPQFEVGRAQIAKGGVVKDDAARQMAIERVIESAAALGMRFVQGMDCPVHGPAGNIEYLAWFKRQA